MHRRRLVAIALAGALASVSLAACGETANTRAKTGTASVLNVGMPNGPQTENHNPFLESSSAASLGYRWMIYEPLVMTNAIRPADAGKPWLATKWEWSNGYKTLALTIRNGVNWSDGQPLRADDVANIFAVPYGDITTSGNTVTVNFNAPQFVNQSKILTRIPIVPKHLWSTIKDPTTDINKNPIGTGPYTLKSFTPQTATLQVRDSYWQELPKVKELRYTSYADNNAQTTALANGSAEWSFVFIPSYKTVYADKDPAHNKVFPAPVLGIHGLFINTTRKPFDNPALRRAMDMVINRTDVFVQAEAGWFHPEVTSVTGIPTPAGESFIAPEYQGKTHKVDVTGARKVLTDAGFTFARSTLKDLTGKPVTISLTDPAGWSDYITSLEIVKDNLSAIGINATVDKANQEAWQKAVEEGTFDATFHWTNGGTTPYDIYQSIMDGALLKPVGTASPQGNFGRFNSPEATRALRDYANAADDGTRSTAMNTLQKIFVEQVPAIPVGADNAGGAYVTKNWVGWPNEKDQYAPAQPTQPNAVDVVLHLKPAS
jgi:peptide/nickel transport system substrate-binding protein